MSVASSVFFLEAALREDPQNARMAVWAMCSKREMHEFLHMARASVGSASGTPFGYLWCATAHARPCRSHIARKVGL